MSPRFGSLIIGLSRYLPARRLFTYSGMCGVGSGSSISASVTALGCWLSPREVSATADDDEPVSLLR